MNLHPLSDIAAEVDALGHASIAAIVAPGHAGELVGTELRRSGAAVVRATRNDVARPGALRERLAGHDERTIVVIDAQWADPESLDDILDRVAPHLGLGTPAQPDPDADPLLVLISRRAAPTGPLARIHQLAERAGLLLGLAPSEVRDLVERGMRTETATAQISRTGGLADLLDAVELDGSLEPEIARRLAATSETARRVAELLAFGGDAADLPRSANLTHAQLDEAMELLIDEGILDELHEMLGGVAAAVRRIATPARRAAAAASLRELDRPGVLDELVAVLDELGDRSAATGELHAELARRHAPLDPRRGLDHVVAARACGADPSDLVDVEAAAALAEGDPRHALRLLARAPDGANELLRGSAWAAVGDLAAAGAALARSELPALAHWAWLGAGEQVDAPFADRSEPLGRVDDATAALRAGLQHWSQGDAALAEEHLDVAVRRYAVDPAAARWPTTPHLVRAIITARAGDPSSAAQTVHDALALEAGGRAHRRTHVLLAAWLAARLGHLDDAADALAEVHGAALSPQEELWRAAAACAIAVRGADGEGLARGAAEANRALRDVGVHLYDLDLVSDVVAAMGRLAAPTDAQNDEPVDLRPARDLLGPIERAIDRLGAPPAFRFDLAWARLRAALAADDLPAIGRRAAELLACETTPPGLAAARRAAELLAFPHETGAGTGEHADAVERTARDLAAIGCAFEAARLCGLVALAVGDESTARRLLKESRAWRATRASLRTSGHVDRSVVRLSDQEIKVAQLVVDGMTHKQIGSTLFISPKTVEHHVAHIRTKLGATTRAEMHAAIRGYLAEVDPPVGSMPS